ncbi:hypothetical protein VPFG_00315 [Vibrio phage nt-1]|uniref:Uncharacterized protein n=1 Tax=Vibrio phage nt-1 TaxID=115992 RepID=R9TGT1_9CAUD|nr:hypothetical protein VPFG_00315 [Vibrio phage nt-1]AGN30313.2 hypothetical protein VPFG_00315 [Vibrio phage nt-1]
MLLGRYKENNIMKDEVTLHIRNHWLHRRAYDILYHKPFSFRKNALAKLEEKRCEFWYVVQRLNPEFFAKCPEGMKAYLCCAPAPRGAVQYFYIKFDK